eukprot:246921-Pleurochrysis_carterae.AAC.4
MAQSQAEQVYVPNGVPENECKRRNVCVCAKDVKRRNELNWTAQTTLTFLHCHWLKMSTVKLSLIADQQQTK